MEYNTAIAVPVEDPSQVGEVRRVAARLADRLGLGETARGNVALAVTEAATNLVRHGGGGKVLLQPVTQRAIRSLDIYALDKGPGIRSVREALHDGFSTAGSAGEGLGAIRRLAAAFDIYSYPEQGTVLFARVTDEGSGGGATERGSAPNFGAICLPVGTEEVCGDAWSVDTGRNIPGLGRSDEAVVRVMMADGLGHGPGAAEAAGEAVQVFEAAERYRSPAWILERAHAALRATRGAAISVVEVDAGGGLTFAGIGNVQTLLLDRETGSSHTLTPHNGIVGHQAQRFADYRLEASAAGKLLIMASDGLTTLGKMDRYPGLLSRHPAVIAGTLFRDTVRGRDDATVVVIDLPEAAPLGGAQRAGKESDRA